MLGKQPLIGVVFEHRPRTTPPSASSWPGPPFILTPPASRLSSPSSTGLFHLSLLFQRAAAGRPRSSRRAPSIPPFRRLELPVSSPPSPTVLQRNQGLRWPRWPSKLGFGIVQGLSGVHGDHRTPHADFGNSCAEQAARDLASTTSAWPFVPATTGNVGDEPQLPADWSAPDSSTRTSCRAGQRVGPTAQRALLPRTSPVPQPRGPAGHRPRPRSMSGSPSRLPQAEDQAAITGPDLLVERTSGTNRRRRAVIRRSRLGNLEIPTVHQHTMLAPRCFIPCFPPPQSGWIIARCLSDLDSGKGFGVRQGRCVATDTTATISGRHSFFRSNR